MESNLSHYEVWLRDKRTGNRRSLMFWADNFAHAEEQATDQNSYFHPDHEEIVKIDKEYESDTVNPTDDWPIPPNIERR